MDRIHSINSRSSESTRYKILTELIEMEFIGARPLLLDALINDTSPLIRHEAAFGLGKLGKKPDIEILIEAMLKDPHEMVRHEAAITLAEIGGEECIPALKQASLDNSAPVASSARFAIQNIYFKDCKIGCNFSIAKLWLPFEYVGQVICHIRTDQQGLFTLGCNGDSGCGRHASLAHATLSCI